MSAVRKQANLLLHLDGTAETPLYQQIYEQFRDAISSGRLLQGDRLMSIRKLSADLGVSHTTVEQAYLQLATEGLVSNVPRSGYIVEHVDTDYMALDRTVDKQAIEDARTARSLNAFFAENRSGHGVRYDFSFANLQPNSFPVDAWRRITNDVLYSTHCPELARYGNTDEPGALRDELARHLARTRGVNCLGDQVIPQAGTSDALTTLLQLFDRTRDVVGMEEPGYQTMHEVARRLGFNIAALPADQGVEEFLRSLDKVKPRIVFTTPSHQFPTGTLLPLDARIQLIQWAEANDAYIIEDDSCNEFRYATRPVPSLQSLDAFGRVVYLGNVSKVLSPALRIAYLVLPPTLLSRYWDLFNFAHPAVSWLDQEVLARFISEGYWDAHVRKTAKGNKRRHDELLHCLRKQMGDALDIQGTDTGMHLYVAVRNGMVQRELLEAALGQDAKVYGTARMWIDQPEDDNHVMIGFSAIAFEDIAPGVEALRRAWFD